MAATNVERVGVSEAWIFWARSPMNMATRENFRGERVTGGMRFPARAPAILARNQFVYAVVLRAHIHGKERVVWYFA